MTDVDLTQVYRDYIACLNRREWKKLDLFVHDDVYYNGRQIKIWGYRQMIERDFHQIPDLYFRISLVISDPPYVASRLEFNCTPTGNFLNIPINGKKISFGENVFYEFAEKKIFKVWSIIDKLEIENQVYS